MESLDRNDFELRIGGDGLEFRTTAEDPTGGACTGTVHVSVPRDRRGDPAVDDGQTYNSLVP